MFLAFLSFSSSPPEISTSQPAYMMSITQITERKVLKNANIFHIIPIPFVRSTPLISQTHTETSDPELFSHPGRP
ncbi:MAG: hypothetical protein QG561_964 [Patescibacteria group bacterium]|nr:hypothetical protein [Patescibacteria group bacterium]